MDDMSDIMSERDRVVFAAAGYGAKVGFGKRPVVLVVDVSYNFCGDRPEPILESVRRWRNSCGEAAWVGVDRISVLLDVARSQRIPVVYTRGMDARPDGFGAGLWAGKNSRNAEDVRARSAESVQGNAIVKEIGPRPQDIVIMKGKPSAFFGTLLASYLTDLGADSILTCGTTTSGCVRASVVDGFSLNYQMSVVEDCVFDRAELSHRVSLLDMDQKYADVVSLDETVAYLRSLRDDLFVDRLRSLEGV